MGLIPTCISLPFGMPYLLMEHRAVEPEPPPPTLMRTSAVKPSLFPPIPSAGAEADYGAYCGGAGMFG